MMNMIFYMGWALVLILFFSIVYTFSFWKLIRAKLNSPAIFDISIITLLSSFIGMRVISVVENFEYYISISWGISPIIFEDSAWRIFSNNPWVFLRISDGNLSYIGLILGLIMGLLIIFMLSNKKKSILELFDYSFVAFSIAILLTFGLVILIENHIPETKVLIRAGYYLVIVAIYFLLIRNRGKHGVLTSIFLLIVGIAETAIFAKGENYAPELFEMVSYYQIITFGLALVGVIILVESTNLNIFKFKRSKAVDNSQELIIKQRESARNTINKVKRSNIDMYSISYSDIGMNSKAKYSISERIRMNINAIKRRIHK